VAKMQNIKKNVNLFHQKVEGENREREREIGEELVSIEMNCFFGVLPFFAIFILFALFCVLEGGEIYHEHPFSMSTLLHGVHW